MYFQLVTSCCKSVLFLTILVMAACLIGFNVSEKMKNFNLKNFTWIISFKKCREHPSFVKPFLRFISNVQVVTIRIGPLEFFLSHRTDALLLGLLGSIPVVVLLFCALFFTMPRSGIVPAENRCPSSNFSSVWDCDNLFCYLNN